MKISIIIPTYKPKYYIEECLSSIQSQSFSKKAFEVIIVLNGDIHPYIEYIENTLKKFDFNAIVLTTQQSGVSYARNTALAKASGKYICFIDDDDFISPYYLEGLYAKVADNQIVASNVKAFIDGTREYTNDYIHNAYNRLKTKHSPFNVLKGRKFMSSSCCKMICKKDIGHIKFNTNLKIGEDSVFMARISRNIKNIVLADENVIYYRRVRQESASRTSQSVGVKVKIVIKLLKEYITMLTPSYNFPFICTRIVAALLKLCR